MGIMKLLFGDYSKRELKRVQPICDQVLALEETYRAMGEEELKSQTDKLRDRLQSGESLDDILPDAGCWARPTSPFRLSAASSCIRAALRK